MSKGIDKKVLKQLHIVEQEILNEIVRVCDENDINYYISGGTLLGAIRHGGFIPWDDDIDMAMLREDYEKFMAIAPKALNDKYFLDCYETNPDCYFPFMKVRKKNTLMDEELVAHLNVNKGIFVDIFPLEKVCKPYSRILRIEAMLIKNIWETISYKYKIIKKISDCRHPFVVFILNLFSLKFLKKIQMRLVRKPHCPDGEFITVLVGAYDYRKEIYDASKLVPIDKVLFEGEKYKTFKNYDYYLSTLFGDYMKLPPVDKRVNHAPENIIFDTEKQK